MRARTIGATLALSAALLAACHPEEGGTTPPTDPPPASGGGGGGGGSVEVGSTVEFVGDYDTGDFSQWTTCQWRDFNEGCDGWGPDDGYQAQIVSDGAGHETAARFEVRDGDIPPFGGGERAEVAAHGDDAATTEGDERWYEFSLKFPSDFPDPSGGWFIVMQWHAGEGSPPLALQVTTEGMLELSNNRSGESTEIGPIQRGEWVDYVIHANFSSGSDALAEVWVNGELAATHTAANMASESNYLKMGIYRDEDDDSTAVVLHDGLRITSP